jgi:hypothetical protein
VIRRMSADELIYLLKVKADALRERENIPSDFQVCAPVSLELVHDVWGSGAEGKLAALNYATEQGIGLSFPDQIQVHPIAYFYL